MFEALDAEVTRRARRAGALAEQAARLAQQVQRAAEAADLHELRQRAPDAAARAQEAAALAGEVQQAAAAFAMAPEGGGADTAYAAAFESACRSEGLALEGTYPDYRVFPLAVAIRLSAGRALLGRRTHWALRPAVLARAVRRERDRLLGGAFAADRFGGALVRCYSLLLPEVRGGKGGGPAQQVSLRAALDVLRLGNFGRHSYGSDEFVFDLYRFRQTDMVAGGHLVMFEDMRRAGGSFEVPTVRGTHERLTGFRAVKMASRPDGAREGAAEAAAAGEGSADGG